MAEPEEADRIDQPRDTRQDEECGRQPVIERRLRHSGAIAVLVHIPDSSRHFEAVHAIVTPTVSVGQLAAWCP